MQISIETYLDDAPARAQQAALVAKNEQINKAIDDNEKKTKEAFTHAMGAMRAGYMVISGMTQAMGGSMAQAFSAMFGIAMAGIGVYQAFQAVELAKGPAGWITAALMSVGLIAAMVQLGAVSVGQEEFASQIGGLNMAIQGIGGMLDSMNFS